MNKIFPTYQCNYSEIRYMTDNSQKDGRTQYKLFGGFFKEYMPIYLCYQCCKEYFLEIKIRFMNQIFPNTGAMIQI